MVEQPSVQFCAMDVDISVKSDSVFRNVCAVTELLITSRSGNKDLELARKNGLLHISRWEPAEQLNVEFKRKCE